jgi:hypothetical protein
VDGGHRFAAYLAAGRETIPTIDVGRIFKLWPEWVEGGADELERVAAMKREAIPHFDHVECGRRRVPVDMYIELYGTGKLPRKYERALERYFKTEDKKEMLRQALRMKIVPVLCPGRVVELVEKKSGDLVKVVARQLLGMARDLISE